MGKITRRFAAAGIAGALALSGLAVSTAAHAEELDGNVALYGYNVGGIDGGAPLLTGGNVADSPMFWGFTVDAGCPAGFQNGGNQVVYQNGTRLGALATTRDASNAALYGAHGMDGQAMHLDNEMTGTGQLNYVANKSLGAVPGIAAGEFEIRFYCFANKSQVNYDTDKWYTITGEVSSDLQTYTIGEAPVGAPTTVSLSGQSNSDKTATLTGTVRLGDGTTATAAAGRVEFFEGATEVCEGTVSAGVASCTTAVLADGAHAFTARFVSDDGAVYDDSPASGTFEVFVGDNGGQTEVTVEIPDNVGIITLTGIPAAIDLGEAALDQGTLQAHGALTGLVVTDTRQLDKPAWSLTGRVSDFVSGTGTVLDGRYVGWEPALETNTDPGGNAATSAGAVVNPGTGNGLKDVATLATSAPVDGKTTTRVGAELNFAAPRNTPAGDYSALLTITLS